MVTGAQPFDRWFDRRPSTTRSEFCRRAGLPEDRDLVLYLASSRSICPGEVERPFVRRWLEALRVSSDPRVARAAVLVRPRPLYGAHWEGPVDPDLGPVEVWPRDRRLTFGEDFRTGLFDSLFHSSAVFGINTTTMIEAAIVGRPVLTLDAPEIRQGTAETVHYRYLLAENGGPARRARDLAEHLAQLSEVLDPARAGRLGDELRRFVQAFVRPEGLDQPATPKLVAAIEEAALAARRPAPPPPGPLVSLGVRLAVRVERGLSGRAVQDALEILGARAAGSRKRARSGRFLFAASRFEFLLARLPVARELVRRGHRVHLAANGDAPPGNGTVGERESLTIGRLPSPPTDWAALVERLRRARPRRWVARALVRLAWRALPRPGKDVEFLRRKDVDAIWIPDPSDLGRLLGLVAEARARGDRLSVGAGEEPPPASVVDAGDPARLAELLLDFRRTPPPRAVPRRWLWPVRAGLVVLAAWFAAHDRQIRQGRTPRLRSVAAGVVRRAFRRWRARFVEAA